MSRKLLLPAAVGLVLASWTAAAGQQPPAAHLSVWIETGGTARVYLSLSQVPNDPAELEQALAAAIGVPLADVKHSQNAAGWGLSAHCDGAFASHGLAVEGGLDPAPLLVALRAQGVPNLAVTFFHPNAGFSECPLGTNTDNPDPFLVMYVWRSAENESLPPLRLAFGYRTEDLWRLAPLAVGLLIPMGLTLWRRRAARRTAADPLEVWFAYWQFQHRLVVGTWCLWLVGLAVFDVSRLVHFAAAGPGGDNLLMTILFLAAPPLLVLLVCRALAAPVLGLPEVGWTPGGVVLQAVLGQGAILCILVASATVLPAVHAGSTDWAALGCAAVVGAALCWGAWGNVRGITQKPLPPGELRDRVTELADDAQVQALQVHVLPPARWRLGNVFAAWPKTAYVTPPLTEHLSMREVDALVAHELVYLWLRQVRQLWVPYALFIAILAVAGVFLALVRLDWIDMQRWWALFVPVVPLLLGLMHSLGLRRLGEGQDGAAVRLTGDTEALLTALAKLERLGLAPVPWRPGRLERLAERANIPPDRLEELLAGPGTGKKCYPPIPPEPPAAPPRPPLTAARHRAVTLLFWAVIAVQVVVPALTVYLGRLAGAEGLVLAAAALAGVGITVLLWKLLVRGVVVWLGARMRRGLRERLAREGLDSAAKDDRFVSLSPERPPRIYNGLLVWDSGFLVLAGDRLCYLGDRTRFALGRGQVRDVFLGDGPPTRRRAPRVHVAWRDEGRGTEGVLTFDAQRPGAWWRPRPAAEELRDRLIRWREGTDASLGPAALAGLAAPDLDGVSGSSPRRLARLMPFLVKLGLVGVAGAGVAFGLGLPFNPAQGGAAWYVLGIQAAVIALQFLPFWLYREPTGPSAGETRSRHTSYPEGVQ